MEKVLFREEQRFNKWWIWLIVTILLCAIFIPVINSINKEQVVLGATNDKHLVLYGIFAVISLIVVLIVTFFVKLKTKITVNGIYVRYLPFMRKWKKLSASDVVKYKVRKYRAILEYGGHGMKERRKIGRAYTMSGNMGLQLYLKNGKKLLIGTQKKQAIEYAMLKLLGEGKHCISNENVQQASQSMFSGKLKKFLIILAIEAIVIIVVFVLIQVFN